MELTSKKRRVNPLAGVVLLLLIWLSVINFKVVQEPISKFFKHEFTFSEFVNAIQNGYMADNFERKSDFINLNGFFARLVGRRVLNDVVRGTNGMLTSVENEFDVTALAVGIDEFSSFLQEYENIPFLYVQLPYKEDLNGELFPEGITSHANKNADNLLEHLRTKNVDTMDLRPQLAQTSEMLQRYFYVTDHHWNPEGVFVAFQEILNKFQSIFPEKNIDMDYTQKEQWERHTIENWFLGSRGKRVGEFFGGTDSLIWYTPRFDTKMSCSIPNHGLFYCGDFSVANVRPQYINEKDYWGYNAYCVYIGGDYPLVQHRNLGAPSDLHVLLLKDSFTLPLQSYFSVVFQEVDVIDPRYFTDCSIAEYVDRTKPDIVVLAINPSSFGTAYQNYGTTEVIEVRNQENTLQTIEQCDITLVAKEFNNYNYATIPLEADSIYTVSFDHVEVLAGAPDGVALTLFNKSQQKRVLNRIFDIAYYEATGKYQWTFRTPKTDETLQLLFYAGIYGSTTGTGVCYRNVLLEKVQ